MLWAAIDPMDYPGKRLENLGAVINPAQFKAAQIYLRAVKEAVCAGTLPFTDAREERQNDQGFEWTEKVEFPRLPEPLYVSASQTRIQQAAFLKWAQSKKIPSMRQTLMQKERAQKRGCVADADLVQERSPVSGGDSQLLLAAPSPLDTTHPCHPPELGVAIEVWTHVVSSGVYNGAKTPKTVIEAVLNTDPKYAGISGIAKERIATTANWNKKGGPPKTPGKTNPPTPQE